MARVGNFLGLFRVLTGKVQIVTTVIEKTRRYSLGNFIFYRVVHIFLVLRILSLCERFGTLSLYIKLFKTTVNKFGDLEPLNLQFFVPAS